MSVWLAIETSSVNYGIALGEGERVLASQTIRRDDPSFPGLAELVSASLARVGREIADIELLALDIGPGNLASVRRGVAYVNGLAFSLGKPIFVANSLRLLALEAAESDERSVLCLRDAGHGGVYAGLFHHGTARRWRYGPLEQVVTALAGDRAEISVAGVFRQEVAALLPHASVKDTGLEFPRVSTLHTLLVQTPAAARNLVALASPVTDSSPLFGAVS
jgi:tRNA threonylcarbamoyladenosine biosynthesis protein TsaB